MPRIKPHELRQYQGAAVARNAGPSRSGNPKIDAAQADKAMFKGGHDAGDIASDPMENFRRSDPIDVDALPAKKP